MKVRKFNSSREERKSLENIYILILLSDSEQERLKAKNGKTSELHSTLELSGDSGN